MITKISLRKNHLNFQTIANIWTNELSIIGQPSFWFLLI